MPLLLRSRRALTVDSVSVRSVPASPGAFHLVGAQLMNSTLVPLWTIFASACASQLVRWTQPCDWVLPMLCGSGVPWMT